MVGSQPRSAMSGWYSVRRDSVGCFICLSPPSCPVGPAPFWHRRSLTGCSGLTEEMEGGRKLATSEHLPCTRLCLSEAGNSPGKDPRSPRMECKERLSHGVQSQQQQQRKRVPGTQRPFRIICPLHVFSNSVHRIFKDSPSLPSYNLFPFPPTFPQPDSLFSTPWKTALSYAMLPLLSQRKHLSGPGPQASRLFKTSFFPSVSLGFLSPNLWFDVTGEKRRIPAGRPLSSEITEGGAQCQEPL